MSKNPTIGRNKFQLLIADFLIVFCMILVWLMSIKDAFQYSSSFNMEYHWAVAFGPLLVITTVLLGFGLFVEYKYNKLSFKNIFLLLGIILVINNILMVSILPAKVLLTSYNGNNVYLDITLANRFYSILYSMCIGITPFLIISVISKNVLHKKYLKIVFYFLLFFPIVLTIISFFTDFNSYINIIKSGFTDFSKPVVSIVRGKFAFSIFLYIGIISCTYLHSIYKNWKWLILAFFFLFITLFTYSKLPLLLSTLYLFIYLLVRIIFFIKKDKDSLIIGLLVLGLIVVIGSLVITFTINSQSGILFKIKNILLKALDTAKTTFRWRTIIWDSSLRILKPYQWVFGFGFYLSGKALHESYVYNPLREESPDLIWHSHNAFIQNIMDGGIIFLLIELFFYAYLFYISIKIYKENKFISIMNFVVLTFMLINAFVDPVSIFEDCINIFFTIVSVIPVMTIYYSTIDKKEMKRREEIIKEAKEIKKVKFDKKILNWNKKYLINSAKNIALDLKNYYK